MNKIETADKIFAATKQISATVGEIRRIGKASDHVYQARMEQFADKLTDVMIELCGMIDRLDPRIDDEDIRTDDEIYAEVREAMQTDRQYAAESIIDWQTAGSDLGDIAGWLETSVDVLVDLIDEFTEMAE